VLSHRITDYQILNKGEEKFVSRISRYGARGILFDEKGKVALMHMSQTGLYKLPGGGIEEGESKEEAFLREIREETGYACKIITFLGVVEEHKSKNDFLHISYCFCAVKKGQRKNSKLTRAETQLGFSLKWYDLETAIEKMETSLSQCDDYTFLFMLKRDKDILEYAKRVNKYGKNDT